MISYPNTVQRYKKIGPGSAPQATDGSYVETISAFCRLQATQLKPAARLSACAANNLYIIPAANRCAAFCRAKRAISPSRTGRMALQNGRFCAAKQPKPQAAGTQAVTPRQPNRKKFRQNCGPALSSKTQRRAAPTMAQPFFTSLLLYIFTFNQGSSRTQSR